MNLFESDDFIICSISLLVTWKDFILLVLLNEEEDKALVFSIGVYIRAKILLKRFALVVKYEKDLPSTSKIGIAGNFLLY